MKNNKLNRKFKRLLAVSLGAYCASTVMACAAEQNANDNVDKSNIQTILLGITQQGRKSIWDEISNNHAAKVTYNAIQGSNLDFSFDASGDQDAGMLPFLLLTCKDNNQNEEVKFMMLADKKTIENDNATIYILPYSEQYEKTIHAQNITKYIKNNPINIAQFEKDCWEHESNIAQYIVDLNSQIHIEPPREYNVGVIQKAKNWWGKLSIQQQVSLTIAGLPVAGIIIQKAL